MTSEKLLIAEFYKDLWRYRGEQFGTHLGAARHLGISPSRFTETSYGYKGDGRYPRPQKRTLERCIERGDKQLQVSAKALRAFYSRDSSEKNERGFSCWLCGFVLFWAGEENLLHQGLRKRDGPERDLMTAVELLSTLVNARYWFTFSSYILDGQAPIFPSALASGGGCGELAKTVLDAAASKDDVQVYELLKSATKFVVRPEKVAAAERTAAIVAVQSFVAEYAAHVAAQVLVDDAAEVGSLSDRPLYLLAKEVYKFGDRQIALSHEVCNTGLAWLLQHDRENGEAAQQYVDALFNTMRGGNPGYFLMVAFSLIDKETAELWHIRPTANGDHFLPPRGNRILEGNAGD